MSVRDGSVRLPAATRRAKTLTDGQARAVLLAWRQDGLRHDGLCWWKAEPEHAGRPVHTSVVENLRRHGILDGLPGDRIRAALTTYGMDVAEALIALRRTS